MFQRIITLQQVEELQEGDVLLHFEVQNAAYSEVADFPTESTTFGITDKTCIASHYLFEMQELDDFILGEPVARWSISDTTILSDGNWWLEKKEYK